MVSIKKLQARGGFLCDPKQTSMVIPIQNVRSRNLKFKCLNWRGPKLDAAYFKVGGDFLPKVAIIGSQKQVKSWR